MGARGRMMTRPLCLLSALFLATAHGQELSSPAGRFASRWDRVRGVVTCDHAQQQLRETQPHVNATLGRCGLSIVGLGWGGIYAAWRLAIDAPPEKRIDPRTICLFESDVRVGGRVLSVRDLPCLDDLLMDVGAYRFQESQLLPRRLIERALLLPSACYEWPPFPPDTRLTCTNRTGDEGPMRKIVDTYGNNGGYGRALETMVQQLEASGATVRFHKHLTHLDTPQHNNQTIRLWFRDGSVVSSDRVMLNLPPTTLQQLGGLLREEGSPLVHYAIKTPTGLPMTKVYVHYEDAWWVSKLGLMDGPFTTLNTTSTSTSTSTGSTSSSATSMRSTISSSSPSPDSSSKTSSSTSSGGLPELQGRYHDGPLKCKAGVDASGRVVYSRLPLPHGECSGALLVYYGYSTQYYLSLASSASGYPLSVSVRNDSAETDQVMDGMHAQLLSLHAPLLSSHNIAPSSLPLPSSLYLGQWWEDPSLPTILKYPDDLTPAQAQQLESVMRRPLPPLPLYITNQGFASDSQGWAESSLIMAEQTLAQHFDLPPPTWLDSDYYDEKVMQQPVLAQE